MPGSNYSINRRHLLLRRFRTQRVALVTKLSNTVTEHAVHAYNVVYDVCIRPTFLEKLPNHQLMCIQFSVATRM
jgi:hypothetical protein